MDQIGAEAIVKAMPCSAHRASGEPLQFLETPRRRGEEGEKRPAKRTR